ncbi:MAG TPA: hypothetical protein VFJ47_10360 [Terriglobales bacterium]|nr:hypothetical protein [Terriglobales bacterium]
MTLREWSKTNSEYGRKLVHSGLEGARCGREEFLHGKPLAPFLNASARQSLGPAVIGACLAILGSQSDDGHRTSGKTLAYGLLGAVVGFGAGMAWESRHLTESVAFGAFRNISKIRDEHWLEQHPIDYA